MTLYLLLAASPLILTPIINSYYRSSVNTDLRARKALLFWFGLFLFVMIAFRSRYLGSTDSLNYYNNWALLRGMSFSRLGSYLETAQMEKGYLVTVWLLSHIFHNPQFVFVFSGLFFTFAICRFVYKYSPNPALSLVMFVTINGYSFFVQGLRQSVAMCICLMSIEFCRQRKLLKFVLTVLIASLFHQTAIVFLVVYFLYGFIMNAKMYGVIAALGIILIMFSSQLTNIANSLFGMEYDGAFESGGYITSLVHIVILAVAIIFAYQKRYDKDYTFFIMMGALGFFTYILRYMNTSIAERISFYFIFGRMIFLPSVVENFDKKGKIVMNAAIIGFSIALFIYHMSSSNLVPYYFFWQK